MKYLAPAVALAVVLAPHAFGQVLLSGPHQYPQFRNLSGMPGCFFGLDFNGDPTFDGAMSFSTPVGATLRGNRYALGLGSTSTGHNFALFDHPGSQNTSNGTAFLMAGFSGPLGNMAISDMILSTNLDHANNVQYSPPLKSDLWGVSFGVQNIANHMAAAGTNVPGDGDISRSFYGVASYKYARGSYLSFGTGDYRFKGAFGSASYQVGDSVKLMTEYDGFNFNSSVAFRLGTFSGVFGNPTPTTLTMALGLVRERYPTWAVTVTF